MRKLLFKNLTEWNQNKRDVFVQETITKGGVHAKTTRRCLYFIKDKVYIKDPSDLQNLAKFKKSTGLNNRHFHVLKEKNVEQGADKLMCKVAGTLYAMVNNYLYCIVFVHTFKISFSTVEQK